MKIFFTIFIVINSLIPVDSGIYRQAQSRGIVWLRSFDDAKREAFFQTKLILIYFERGSAEGGYKMETETWNLMEIIELSKRFICLRADIQQWRGLRDQYERLRSKFRVDVYPTTVITDPVGNEFYHGEGFIHAADLDKVMRALPRNLFAVYQSLRVLDAEPNSISARINVGIAYHHMRVAHISNRLLEEVLGSDTLKLNVKLEESVETYRAINYHLLGELQRSISLFERLLDKFPNGEKQPVHLYYLAKLYIQNLNETQAKRYLRILQKRFPDHNYTRQAETLFIK